MKIVTWDSPIVDFLSAGNVIYVENKEEYLWFANKMASIGLDMSRIYKYDPVFPMIVEYNNGKGFTRWDSPSKTLDDTIKECVSWYGCEPIKVSDLMKEPEDLSVKYEVVAPETARLHWWYDTPILIRNKETHEIKRIIVQQDYNAENPRDWGNLCTIVSVHGNWDISDKGHSMSREEMEEWLSSAKKEVEKGELHMRPVYMYDHSGQTISLEDFKDPWDSGVCAIIYMEKATALEANSTLTDDNWKQYANKCMQDEIEVYNDYISGDVHYIRVEKANTKWHLDVCTGKQTTSLEWEEDYDEIGGTCYGYERIFDTILSDIVGTTYEFIEEIK